MIDASSKSARAIAVSAVFVAAAVHATMNASFGYNLGSHPSEKYLFAAFGVSSDICKVFALAFAALAWEKGRYAKAVCCLLVWATTVTYSGAAALGFAAVARDTVVASRSSDADETKANSSDLKRLQVQMERARDNPLFAETYGCTEYNRGAAKGEARKKAEFCSAYWRADVKIDELRPKVKSATLTEADPQTAIMAKMLGWPRESVAVALAVFLAVVAEIVSALGTYVFSTSRRVPARLDRPNRVERPRIVVSN